MSAREEMRRCEQNLVAINRVIEAWTSDTPCPVALMIRNEIEDEFLRWREVDELERAVKPVGQS